MNGSEPVDPDQMRDSMKLVITRHNYRIRPNRRGHCKGISIGNGESSLNPRCLQDVAKSIGHGLDRQCLQPTEEFVGLLKGPILCRHIVHLSEVDLVHEERLLEAHGLLEESFNLFEPAFSVEEHEHGEGIEQTSFLHALGPPYGPPGALL